MGGLLVRLMDKSSSDLTDLLAGGGIVNTNAGIDGYESIVEKKLGWICMWSSDTKCDERPICQVLVNRLSVMSVSQILYLEAKSKKGQGKSEATKGQHS